MRVLSADGSTLKLAVKRFPGRSPTVDQVCTFPHPSFQMAKSVAKYSIMTQEMVDSFCEAFYIPAGVHPTAPGRDKTIIQFPAEKDSAPLLTARQEETVRLLESHKAPFRRYPECFLCQVGLSKYYPFDDNSYPAYEYSNGSDMGLLDFIQTADPRKVRAVEVQKGGLISSAAAAEVPVLTEEMQEGVAPEDAYLNLADPDEDAIAVWQGDERVVSEQPKKVKKRRLIMSEGSHLLAWEQLVAPSVVPPSQEGEGFVDLSAQGSFQILTTAESSGTLSAPVDTAAAATTSTRPAMASKAVTDVGPSHPEESESSDDSFYEIPNVDPAMAKRWYVPKWNITNDSLLDDAFSCRTLVDRVAPPAFFSDLCTKGYDQLFTEFNVGEERQICLGSEVRSRTEHELELKEKLRAKYAARGKLLEKRDLEILELKSKLAKKETEAAEAVRLCDQVSSLLRRCLR
ncbi:hypothetical protein Tco_0492869 [Tanacetum coccineum]